MWKDKGIPGWFNYTAFVNIALGIDDQYVSGISLTHGAAGRRQHIWTFASGVSEMIIGRLSNEPCPCDTASPSNVSAFIGNDYTSVRVVYTPSGATIMVYFFLVFSGMVRTVHPPAHAVSSTILHGLQRTCQLPQLITLN